MYKGSLKSLEVSLSLQYALPYLRQRQGNIINVSSLVATIGQKDAAPYVATKVSYSSKEQASSPASFYSSNLCLTEMEFCNVILSPQGGDHFHDKGDGCGWESLQRSSELVRHTGLNFINVLYFNKKNLCF